MEKLKLLKKSDSDSSLTTILDIYTALKLIDYMHKSFYKFFYKVLFIKNRVDFLANNYAVFSYSIGGAGVCLMIKWSGKSKVVDGIPKDSVFLFLCLNRNLDIMHHCFGYL